MSNRNHFNVVSGSVFHGRNLEAVQAAASEAGYKSNKWITYFQASELGLKPVDTLKGKGVGLIRYAKVNGKSAPKWYNVFNLDCFQDVPQELLKKRTPSDKKAKKPAKKQAAKKAKSKVVAINEKATKPSEAAKVQVPENAIPMGGDKYLLPLENGLFQEVTIAS